MLAFTLMRNFASIHSSSNSYLGLTFATMMPRPFFQESAVGRVNSMVGNTTSIKKVQFSRENDASTAVATKMMELGMNLLIPAATMVRHGMLPTA
jgi:ABC-type polysaccharide/polyol phosphate export permease